MILRSDRFRGPRMVMLAFFIMNLAVGLTYGAFGALVLPLEAHFGTTRSLISLAMSLDDLWGDCCIRCPNSLLIRAA